MSTNQQINSKKIGIIGATGMVGDYLLTMSSQSGWIVNAYYRQKPGRFIKNVNWIQLPNPNSADFNDSNLEAIEYWICTAPIWVLSEYFGFLKAHQAKRIIALSSTSRFTKSDSSDKEERTNAQRMAESEMSFQEWCEAHSIEWAILRPTLIYGLGRDKNISEITKFIHRFGFFPLFGQANGLRQPIHLHDVANACLVCLQSTKALNRAYNISGGEILSYRDMVNRVFIAMGLNPRFLRVPLFVFSMTIAFLRILPRYRHWSPAMAERMNRDMIFDHSEAARDLAFNPRVFMLSSEDIAV